MFAALDSTPSICASFVCSAAGSSPRLTLLTPVLTASTIALSASMSCVTFAVTSPAPGIPGVLLPLVQM